MKGAKERPVSVATEFMESDFDDDEILSEIDDGENSPRASVNSSGQPSFTTVSSYDEVHTPRSSRAPTAFQFDLNAKPVEGPRGPHLFRSSSLSVHSVEYQNALSLSPVTPKTARPGQTEFHLPIALDLTSLPSARRRQSGPFQFTDEELDDTTTLAEWSPEKVAQWMLNAGVELQIAEKFVENDITGGILITLKFEDLKELGIPSFGARTKVWDEIHVMRNIKPSEPAPETPIEDEPDREVRREQRRMDDDGKPRRKKSKAEDIISPLESVSIVGIEQMMPKPHHCSKGENCSKWKRQQKMLEAFKKDHPFVDMDKGGIIMVAGDPGNAVTASALNKPQDDFFRPISDAIPSVVASSDILGTEGLPPLQYLQEATLRNLQARDPQDNVRQFLDFQHAHVFESSEVPPTPPFEITPTPQPPHQALRSLPRLSIPVTARNTPQPTYNQPCSATAHPDDDEYEQATPTGVYRFGTPFSEMDVPVTAVPLGPVARDVSQSVPPDMNYRHGPVAPISRSVSRATARRPSFPVMPALDENKVAAAVVSPRQSPRQSPQSLQRKQGQRQLQPPPRMQYPWTSERPAEKAIPPVPSSATSSSSFASACFSSARLSPSGTGSTSPRIKDAEGVTYAGPMRKRKTKMLRHEWQEHFFTLKGTRLNMHKDEASATRERTLEYIDIDDYAIACSSLASSNKLSAKFKAMSIRRGSSEDKQDVAAFSFQLVPQDAKGGVKLRKRESVLPSSSSAASSAAGPEGAANGTGKSHYFAVKSRDERIDWMRELMLAKALKQKGEGFEVSVNGNMI
ncbi:uncharacterized protein E0L32_001066 [Thyridium curvatum]|uniref:Uncharacterized protein n=1 Tax=Thyridium curvatum TaxID=1093900 RepID=A0A507B2W3_9PEZI|nr:uncharacterized protein E0L32_001066 [Thyridium curvatum]TPX11248.1 hypothetical protein E0L32_001066 [Thyridium curvatum]